MKNLTYIITCLSVLLYSCHPKSESTPTPVAAVTTQDVVNQYAEVAYQQYHNAFVGVQSLEAAIDSFLLHPTDQNFTTAKEAWKTARRSYSLLEGYRFYGGPIDDPSNEYESKLNAWPMDESEVDYVVGNDSAGIINKPSLYPTINTELILDNDGKAGETSITTGFHVVEFLLWGQDIYTTSAGRRPFTDYIVSTVAGTRNNAQRRGQYLKVVTGLMVQYLQEVALAWEPGKTDNYRATFTNPTNASASMTNVLKGLGTFSKAEFGGERLAVAYASKDQEDEHDCFSDFTTTEIGIWQQGIINIYYGKYKKADGSTVDGAGINDLMKLNDAAFETDFEKSMSDAYTDCLAVPDPFDNAIRAGDVRVKTVIDDARAQGDKFVTIGTKLGYTVTNETE